ncbi:MAG: hypothetical protein NTZ03_10200, partial [Actinobacteria bacterium]|nr:hypothetical protein [Actinomycetota bacterium]
MVNIDLSLQESLPLTSEQRARLAELADTLIAGGAGLPSASQAEVHTVWIDRVFAARPDMESTVREVLSLNGNAQTLVADLQQSNPDQFTSFAFAIAGAWLINPRVRRELGYPGPVPMRQPALPDEADAYLEDGILDVVIARGPIYRPTP